MSKPKRAKSTNPEHHAPWLKTFNALEAFAKQIEERDDPRKTPIVADTEDQDRETLRRLEEAYNAGGEVLKCAAGALRSCPNDERAPRVEEEIRQLVHDAVSTLSLVTAFGTITSDNGTWLLDGEVTTAAFPGLVAELEARAAAAGTTLKGVREVRPDGQQLVPRRDWPRVWLDRDGRARYRRLQDDLLALCTRFDGREAKHTPGVTSRTDDDVETDIALVLSRDPRASCRKIARQVDVSKSAVQRSTAWGNRLRNRRPRITHRPDPEADRTGR